MAKSKLRQTNQSFAMSLLAETQKRSGYTPIDISVNEAPAGRLESPLVRKSLALGLVCAATLTLLVVATGQASEAPALGKSKPARACSFVECEMGGCDADLAPYLCLDEDGPLMGCSAVSWEPAACAASCDMSACADAAPPKGTKTCAGKVCSDDVCESYQKCGSAAPYQCTEGSAVPGCSSDEFGWALADAVLCGDCCDTSSC